MHDTPLLSGMCLCVWKHWVNNPFCSQSATVEFLVLSIKDRYSTDGCARPCVSFPLPKSQNTWWSHSSLSNHAKVINLFAALGAISGFGNRMCGFSGATLHQFHREAYNQYSSLHLKANNVEFNPPTWLWHRCSSLLTAALPQSYCFQPQKYSKLVEITFCLAPPSIKPCLTSYLMLTNDASACDVSWIHGLVDAWRISAYF